LTTVSPGMTCVTVGADHDVLPVIVSYMPRKQMLSIFDTGTSSKCKLSLLESLKV